MSMKLTAALITLLSTLFSDLSGCDLSFLTV